MAILLTLLTFLLFIAASYFRSQRAEVEATAQPAVALRKPLIPEMVSEEGFEIPRGYSFHPGHTWVLQENGHNARVGMDALASKLVGKVDELDAGPLYRWVRQGQKLWTVKADGVAVDMVSPVEGVVVAVNPNVVRKPSALVDDPYGEGWVLAIQSPFLENNFNNLIRGPLIRHWMADSLERIKDAVLHSATPQLAYAQDGGVPVEGLLLQVDADLREQLTREIFLS
jgi:glycine cleavage system H lipoate-binding protein